MKMFPNLRVFRTDLSPVCLRARDPMAIPTIWLQLAKFRDTMLLNLPLSLQRLDIYLLQGPSDGLIHVDSWNPISEALRRFPELKKLNIHIVYYYPEGVELDGVCALYFPELHAKGALDVDVVRNWSDIW